MNGSTILGRFYQAVQGTNQEARMNSKTDQLSHLQLCSFFSR